MLFVPNHTNALVDPLLPVISVRRRLTVTAKNVLARNPLLRLLIWGMDMVTFHRRADVGKGADPRENVRSLKRCREILARGGAICIFPEGVSHSDPKLREFHAGPARIALDFVRKDGNPGRLRIVPVGLLYTDKDRFRSGVWLRFGEPIDVESWTRGHPDAGAEELTEELRRRVAALTLNYETRRESALLSWTAEIVATGARMPRRLGWEDRPVADRFRLLARLQAGYRTLLGASGEKGTDPLPPTEPGDSDRARPPRERGSVPFSSDDRKRQRQEVEDLSQRIRRYRVELKRDGIAPDEVYLPIHAGRAAFFVVREAELAVVGAPMALFGALNHLAPYLIVRAIARKLSKDKDHWASNVVYPSFVIFPLFYLVQLAAAWLLLPALSAAVYSIALPYTGYYALLYGDRLPRTFRRARTFLRFLVSRGEQERLAAEGRSIVTRIQELAEELEHSTGERGA